MVDEHQPNRNIERNINSDDAGAQTSSDTVNYTSFHFIRTSIQGVSPLVSTLTIINVTNNLNRTRVHCVEVDGSMSANFTTIIVIIETHHSKFTTYDMHECTCTSHRLCVFTVQLCVHMVCGLGSTISIVMCYCIVLF